MRGHTRTDRPWALCATRTPSPWRGPCPRTCCPSTASRWTAPGPPKSGCGDGSAPSTPAPATSAAGNARATQRRHTLALSPRPFPGCESALQLPKWAVLDARKRLRARSRCCRRLHLYLLPRPTHHPCLSRAGHVGGSKSAVRGWRAGTRGPRRHARTYLPALVHDAHLCRCARPPCCHQLQRHETDEKGGDHHASDNRDDEARAVFLGGAPGLLRVFFPRGRYEG